MNTWMLFIYILGAFFTVGVAIDRGDFSDSPREITFGLTIGVIFWPIILGMVWSEGK